MSDARWRIHLFGGLRAVGADKTLAHLSMRRIGSLLACLAIRSPQPVAREELIGLLWPEAPGEQGRLRLRVMLNGLRTQLEPRDAPASVLVTDRSAVHLLPAAFTSDYHDFLRALQSSKATTVESEAISHLELAVGLYVGDLLAGHYDEWVLIERERLAGLRFWALRDLTRRFMTINSPDRAIEHARTAVGAEPLDEEAHADLMRAYQACGQPSAALRQYQQLKRLLIDELRAEPAPETRALAAQIEASLGHGVSRVTRSVRPVALNREERATAAGRTTDTLPRRLTRFFGRVNELSDLRGILDPTGDTRLVSLIGTGGAGKTRLAIEVAEQLRSRYGGRVYFAPLADITDPAHIGAAIATALRLPPTVGLDALSQAAAALSHVPSLLILDNVEQLLPEARALIESLVLDVASLRCMLTSRLSAGIEGEREFTVGPLPRPAAQAGLRELATCASVELFIDRVRSVSPEFELTEQNSADVAEVCRVIEGLPLAIELAAARARVMSAREMRKQASRLLNLLVDVREGKPARHRSLRATLEWSYNLLNPAEQRFFGAMSVFVGGFSADAAEYVAFGENAATGDSITLVERLRGASLLNRTETDVETPRFSMLETVRQFAGERLAGSAEKARTRARHLVYFARAFWTTGETSSQLPADETDRVQADEANLRDALEFGMRHGAAREEEALALALVEKLSGYWELNGRWEEGRSYLLRAGSLSVISERPESKLNVLNTAGLLSNLLGDYEQGRSLSGEGITLAGSIGDALGLAGCLRNLGGVEFSLDDYAAARAHFERALQIYSRLEDRRYVAACSISLGDTAFYLGDHPSATERYERALEIYDEFGDRRGIGMALQRLGNLWRNRSRFSLGRDYLIRALTIFREERASHGVADCLQDLGVACYCQAEYEESQHCTNAALEVFREIGSRRGINVCLVRLACVAHCLGDIAKAQSEFREALDTLRKTGDRRNLATCLCAVSMMALDNGDQARALVSVREALALEIEISSQCGIANCRQSLARLSLERKDAEAAYGDLNQALVIYQDIGVEAGVIDMLDAHAQFALIIGQPERAALLVGFAAAMRRETGYLHLNYPRIAERTLNEIRDMLGEEVFDTFRLRGEAISPVDASAEARRVLLDYEVASSRAGSRRSDPLDLGGRAND